MSKNAIRKVSRTNRRKAVKLARKFGYDKLATELGKIIRLG